MTKPGDPGTCGFCGFGEGWLGDQGDESTRHLHSAVRTGEPGDWSYKAHPGSLKDKRFPDGLSQTIIWCGNCISGLKHMFQRESDHNLNAEYMALKFWLELDAPHFSFWEARTDEDRKITKKYQDDPAIHMDKVARQDRVSLMQHELSRRAGFDLTTRGWRP